MKGKKSKHIDSRLIKFYFIVLRWEDEYYAAYKKYSGLLHLNEANVGEKNIVKASSPEKFVNAITKSADKLLGN